MASSHLLGAGVSDCLGVPSVSLLSEDAVASESVGGALVRERAGGSGLPLRGATSTLWKGPGRRRALLGRPPASGNVRDNGLPGWAPSRHICEALNCVPGSGKFTAAPCVPNHLRRKVRASRPLSR